MKMCQAFAKNDCDVTLFAAKSDGFEGTQQDLFTEYDVEQNFHLQFIKRLKIKGFWGLVYIQQLLKIIKKLGAPDLFYGRHAPSLLALSLKHPAIDVSYEAHALPFGFFRKLIEKRLLKNKSFTKLVVISEILKQDYLQLFPFLEKEDVIVAHDGADLAKSSLEPMKLKGSASIKAGYIGKLTEGKGLGIILGAAQKSPKIDFHIFGGNQAELEHWQSRAKDSKNIFFYGHVSHGDLKNIYPSLDIMLAPLQDKMPLFKGKWDIGRWTSPLKIFEYMAQAKAIIASDSVVLREILQHNKTALLINSTHVEKWVEAIEILGRSKEKREQLGQAALFLLEENYTWHIRAKKILSVFK